MFNPLHFSVYQKNFWDKTSMGTKSFVVTYTLVSAVAFRLFFCSKNNTIPPALSQISVYEYVGITSFLVYLITSTVIGYWNTSDPLQ